jgi:predicted PurR-regulated permease PerM
MVEEMKLTNALPDYAKLAAGLLSLSLIIALLYVGQHILVPILLSLLFAILLRPLVRFLNVRLKFPHVIAVSAVVVLFVLLIAGIILFVSNQASTISNDWDTIQRNLQIHYHHFQKWIKLKLHISYSDQEVYFREAKQSSLGGNALLGTTINNFTDVLLSAVLIPFYTFLFLLYRNLFMRFLTRLVKPENQEKLQEILYNVKIAIQGFLVGLLFEMGIVIALTATGLMIVGVPYALLLGVITGLLNLIPYIGILIAAVLSIIAALTTGTEASAIIGVVVVNIIVQLIDNNLIVPFVVSSKVRINAVVSMIGIVIGGAIAGVAGMFLAIPIIAILKVIFDRIPSLAAWGYLMGDDLPKTFEWANIKFPSMHAGNNDEHGRKEDQENMSDKL